MRGVYFDGWLEEAAQGDEAAQEGGMAQKALQEAGFQGKAGGVTAQHAIDPRVAGVNVDSAEREGENLEDVEVALVACRHAMLLQATVQQREELAPALHLPQPSASGERLRGVVVVVDGLAPLPHAADVEGEAHIGDDVLAGQTRVVWREDAVAQPQRAPAQAAARRVLRAQREAAVEKLSPVEYALAQVRDGIRFALLGDAHKAPHGKV